MASLLDKHGEPKRNGEATHIRKPALPTRSVARPDTALVAGNTKHKQVEPAWKSQDRTTNVWCASDKKAIPYRYKKLLVDIHLLSLPCSFVQGEHGTRWFILNRMCSNA